MISKNQAIDALLETFEERKREGSLLRDSENYFYGCYDRWAGAISALSRASVNGKILDIGAWDGMFCCSLVKLGFSAVAVDWGEHIPEPFWQEKKIHRHDCNIEADPLPFPDNEFTGVYMGQILEHFSYSPKKPLGEIRRILKPGGILVVDVPNVGELNNFYRLLRGKNILYDYKRHYIDEEPRFYKGLPYWDRHNREFTANDLRVLGETCGFDVLDVSYIRSVRHKKTGIKKLGVPFSAIRDLIPLFRKSLMLTAQKPLKPRG